MATPILRGSDDPQLQNFEIQFNPNTGSSVTKEFKGISYSKMAGLAQMYGAARWSGTLRSEFGVATLKVSGSNFSDPNSPVNDITDKWEISVDQEKPDLCENYYFKASLLYAESFVVGATEQIIQCLRATATSDDKTWDGFWTRATEQNVKTLNGKDIPYTYNGTDMNLAVVHIIDQIYYQQRPDFNVFKLFCIDFLRGADVFFRGKYVLRHTTNAPSDYSANVADYGVEKIYSIAQLLSECQDSNSWILPLPGYLAYKINSYPEPFYLPSNYMWGALKLRSSATTAAMGRIEISTEYLIDAIPIHTYGTL